MKMKRRKTKIYKEVLGNYEREKGNTASTNKKMQEKKTIRLAKCRKKESNASPQKHLTIIYSRKNKQNAINKNKESKM